MERNMNLNINKKFSNKAVKGQTLSKEELKKSYKIIKKERRALALNTRQSAKFERLYEKKGYLIIAAYRKLDIPKYAYNEYLSYALEGFLQCFLMLEEGVISREKFDAYTFRTIKHAIIREISRRNRGSRSNCSYEFYENSKNQAISEDEKIILIELFEHLQATLTPRESIFLKIYLELGDVQLVANRLEISRRYSNKILQQIRQKSEEFLLDRN